MWNEQLDSKSPAVSLFMSGSALAVLYYAEIPVLLLLTLETFLRVPTG